MRLLQGELYVVEELGAVGLECRECACSRKVLQHTLVDRIRTGKTHAEVHEARIGTIGLALCHNRLGGHLADTLDSAQAIAYALRIGSGHEARTGFVHIRQLQLEPHLLRFSHEAGQLVEVAYFGRNLGAHEFGGIVRLHISRLVGDPCVAYGVGLVERVGCERLPVGPYLLDKLGRFSLVLPFVDAELGVLHAALDELGLEFVHYVHELLAHGLAKLVRLATSEAGEKSRQKHDLFLIDRDAVGILQILLHQRMVVGDRLVALLSRDKARYVLHRTWAVESIHGDQVGKTLGLERHEPLLHSVRLELEKAGSLAASEKLVGQLVVVRYLVRIEVDAPLLQKRYAFLLDSKRLEPEEVHLQKANGLDVMAVILSRKQLRALRGVIRTLLLAALLRGRHDRQCLDKRIPRYDDAASMHARLSDRTFETGGALKQLVYCRISRLERGIQIGRHLSRLLEGDLRRVRHQSRQLVRIAKGIVHHAADILDGRFGGHLAKGYDMRHMVCAILSRNVIQHAFTTGVVEVDVDIRHRNAVGVEEAFEQQVVFEGIDVRDAQGVGDSRTCRGTAPGTDPHAKAPCSVYVIVDYQEVPRETHRTYRVELELNAF